MIQQIKLLVDLASKVSLQSSRCNINYVYLPKNAQKHDVNHINIHFSIYLNTSIMMKQRQFEAQTLLKV